PATEHRADGVPERPHDAARPARGIVLPLHVGGRRAYGRRLPLVIGQVFGASAHGHVARAAQEAGNRDALGQVLAIVPFGEVRLGLRHAVGPRAHHGAAHAIPPGVAFTRAIL